METVASDGHSIGVVARRTGLKPDLIRAWERRYGAVEPTRSEGRHRVYSDADVERLTLLKRAVEGGRSIGSVADRPNEELLHLIAGDRAASAGVEEPALAVGAPRGRGGGRGAREEILSDCLEPRAKPRRDGAPGPPGAGRRGLSRSQLLLEVIVPLMRRIGDLWRQGDLRPIHEHLASGVVRTFVGGLRDRAGPGSRAAPRWW